MTVTLRPAVNPAVERHLSYFQAARNALPGAAQGWVNDLRSRAVDVLARDGFPTTRIESWKYTDLRHVFRKAFVDRPYDVEDVDISTWLIGEGVPVAVFVDGRFSEQYSKLEGLPAGVTILPLSVALETEASGISEILGSIAPLETPGLTALNSALMQDGAFIQIDENIELDRAVQILCLTSKGFAGEAHLRHVVSLGRAAKATIVQGHFGLGPSGGLCNVVTEAVIGEGGTLRMAKRQEENSSAWHIGLVQARLDRNASFDSFTLSSGGRTARNEIRVRLAGEGANAVLNGLALARGRQHCDNTTDVEHAVPYGTSDQLYKSVVDDDARSVFLGRILVAEDAQKTDARQMNRNLLLSPGAQADSKPELIIHADDVKCAHGATVGDLDEEALFYLMSRGIGAAEARGLLVRAFAEEMIEAIADKEVRAWLDAGLAEWLGQGNEQEQAA
jgi:Fe-S cluster assembly protein SufD